jgi:hypothetical protein
MRKQSKNPPVNSAIVIDGVVTGIVSAPSGWSPDDGELVPCSYQVQVGWRWNGSVFAQPNDIPASVTETQFMRAAVKVGIVTAAEAKAYLARGVIPAFVETAVAQIPANVRTDAELKIIGSDTFHRTDPVFAMLIAGGAATSEQVDDLFRLAATLD